MKISVFALLGLLCIGCGSRAGPLWEERVVLPAVESEAARFRVVQVVSGLEHPWAIAFLPDGRWLVTERPGRLWVVTGNELSRVQGVPEVRALGQGGLLDVIAHPRFEENQWIYLSYAATYGDGIGTRVMRARLDGDRLRDGEVIFEMQPSLRGPVHFGSRFAFDTAGYLYVTLGERGHRDYAQRLDAHQGSVLRLHEDGRVPADNPFVDESGALPEIYTYGHRNPQGIVFDEESGLLWTHEHGPRGGDALHIIRPGRNYGWPLATHGEEYRGGSIGTVPERREDIVNPVLHWTPSIAPCGLTQYRGQAFPDWDGHLFVGALVKQHIRRLVLDGERVIHQEVLLKNRLGRIREITLGPAGHLWFATDARDGGIFRIEPVP